MVVNVLCTASVAYANQWKLMRAEDLAVEAVQQAKYDLLSNVDHFLHQGWAAEKPLGCRLM